MRITSLKVDGGMTANGLLMRHQADVLDVPVIRPVVSETTCPGAAYAAGLATGVWQDLDELRAHWKRDQEWTPRMEAEAREREYRNWCKAVERTFGWGGGRRDVDRWTTRRTRHEGGCVSAALLRPVAGRYGPYACPQVVVA